MSSTGTLTIRVCGCSSDGIVQSCNVEAYVLPIGLSMGALIAILACIILLLGERRPGDGGALGVPQREGWSSPVESLQPPSVTPRVWPGQDRT